MTPFFTLIVYLAAGIILAYFSTVQIRLVAGSKIWRASFLTFFLQVVNLFVLANIIAEINSKRSVISVLVYAFGISVGTFIALHYKHFEGSS